MMNSEELKAKEDALRKEIATLPPQQKKEYFTKELKALKDPDTYAVLNYTFLAGLHHFYLSNYTRGCINLLVMLVGILFIKTFGIILFFAVIIIELPQLFRSQFIVQKYNVEMMQRTLNEVRDTDYSND